MTADGTLGGSTWGNKSVIPTYEAIYGANRKEALNLVVPLIYFWRSAIHIDVPLSGSVLATRLHCSCAFYSARRRMLSDAFDITLPPVEKKPH